MMHLHATRAAVEEGIVAGGGVAFSTCQSCPFQSVLLENADEETGLQIVARAIESPLRTIVENAGGEGSVVVAKVLDGKGDFGYDAKSEKYVEHAQSRNHRSYQSNQDSIGKCCFCCGYDSDYRMCFNRY